MNETLELFFQTVRFTPLLGVLDLLLIVHFICSWYRSAKKTGWKIDFWYITLFLGVFIHLLILYPFNGSAYNILATRGHIESIFPFVDVAFLISVCGYFFIWVGRYSFDLFKGKFPLVALIRCIQPFSRMVENNIKNTKVINVLALAAFSLGAIILAIQFWHGEIANGRRFFLRTPEFRPFFNATIAIISMALSFFAVRFAQFKEKRVLFFFTGLALISLCFGIRSIFIAGCISLFLQQVFYREGKVRLFKLGLLFPAFFFIAVALGNLREGNYGVLTIFKGFFFSFFYGNNFSDTRDFAWVLSYWDGEYLYGKSYLAGILSFIPRALCSFREEWNISMFTNAITGFDSNEMPGLRPGLFGESFLNFGLLGVILYGWTFGFVLRFADIQLKECMRNFKDLIQGHSNTVLFAIVMSLSVTAGLWGIYVFILMNLALVLVRGTSVHDKKITGY